VHSSQSPVRGARHGHHAAGDETVIEAPLFRIMDQPSVDNGLRKTLQMMADKAMTLKCDKVGSVVRRIEAEILVGV